jgi:hypothetical protein
VRDSQRCFVVYSELRLANDERSACINSVIAAAMISRSLDRVGSIIRWSASATRSCDTQVRR